MDLIIQWIDAIWLPLVFVICRKHQWIYGLGFVLCGMLMMRLMIELMASIGYPFGILGLWDEKVFTRGLYVYNGFYALFMILAYFSPETRGSVFLAASISLFITAMVVFAGVMVL